MSLGQSALGLGPARLVSSRKSQILGWPSGLFCRQRGSLATLTAPLGQAALEFLGARKTLSQVIILTIPTRNTGPLRASLFAHLIFFTNVATRCHCGWGAHILRSGWVQRIQRKHGRALPLCCWIIFPAIRTFSVVDDFRRSVFQMYARYLHHRVSITRNSSFLQYYGRERVRNARRATFLYCNMFPSVTTSSKPA